MRRKFYKTAQYFSNMKTVFLEAPYIGKVSLCKKTVDYLKKKKIKTVGLYAVIQFCHNLSNVRDQLQSLGITVVTSQAKRTDASQQILGCDVYEDSLNLNENELSLVDAFLYIGDGKFHPLALLHGQKADVICDDPLGKTMEVLDKSFIERILKKQRGSLATFYASDNIGVIITTKPGQQFMLKSFELEKKYPNKKFYYFLDDTISFGQLENFPFIDVWVNTACPRIGLDDIEKFRKGVVNLRDVL